MPFVKNLNFPPFVSAHDTIHFWKANTASNGRTEHTPSVNAFLFEKDCVSPGLHYRKLYSFCIGFYGNRKLLIISKISHI